MFNRGNQRHTAYLDLSIEALWMARVFQDGLDILLAHPVADPVLNAKQTKVLTTSRNVFERLGVYGCSADRVNPASDAWTAASRTDLIRQVAVHWRAFIDASFGMPCASKLILSLTDYEVRVLEHILKLELELHTKRDAVVHCMQQELDAWSSNQIIQRVLRCQTYMESVQSRMG